MEITEILNNAWIAAENKNMIFMVKNDVNEIYKQTVAAAEGHETQGTKVPDCRTRQVRICKGMETHREVERQ